MGCVDKESGGGWLEWGLQESFARRRAEIAAGRAQAELNADLLRMGTVPLVGCGIPDPEARAREIIEAQPSSRKAKDSSAPIL